MTKFETFEAACEHAKTEVLKVGKLSAGCWVEGETACFHTAKLATGRSMEGPAKCVMVHPASGGGFFVS